MYYLGMDWGHGDKSKSVFTVSIFANGKLTPIFVKKFIPADGGRDYELKYVQSFMRKYPNSVLGVDYGDGYLEDGKLIEEFGAQRVYIIMHNDSMGAIIKFDINGNHYVTNRTMIMTKHFATVNNNEFPFIGQWEGMWDDIFSDYIAVTRERRRNGRVVYVHTDPDDAMQSNLYSNIAFMLRNGILKPMFSDRSSEDFYRELEVIYQNEYNYQSEYD
jgi:hypothetical protein